MKKTLSFVLALAMVIGLLAGTVTTGYASDKEVSITLWTYPIGNWGNEEAVKELIAGFEEANPGIKVTVEYLAYADGDDKVNTAIEGKNAPDLIMEGPERLVANWGAKGYMVDLADLWTDEDKAEINEAVQSACFNEEGASYEYPVCMTAHCMAVNLDRFKAAGADKFLHLDTRTWSTEEFVNAVAALYEAKKDTVAAIYCGGQGGDQGTRALINNLFGGTFTNPEHTAYTADSEANVEALELLKSMEGINFDASLVGGDEINLFRQGVLDMAFCWNIGMQLNSDNAEAGYTNDGEEIAFMAFPTETGEPKLQGGIWGFGIFDNGDADKIAAARTFIEYFGAGAGTKDAVLASTYFPVRESVKGEDISNLYEGNDVMSEYTKLMPFLGDYYQVTKGWAEARTAWWNMLQRIGDGGSIMDEVKAFVTEADAAAAKS